MTTNKQAINKQTNKQTSKQTNKHANKQKRQSGRRDIEGFFGKGGGGQLMMSQLCVPYK